MRSARATLRAIGAQYALAADVRSILASTCEPRRRDMRVADRVTGMAEISADDVIRAAATPADALARAEAIAELNLGARAEHERLADETTRAYRIAELAARMTHCIDGAPLEIYGTEHDPETIEFRHLLDASRWALYTPIAGRFRLWRRAYGDLNAADGEDFDHADEAESAALAWVLRR